MQEFRILWFEDNLKDFDDVIAAIQSHLNIHTRKLQIEHYEYYPEDFDVKLFEPQYCLLLVDLNLKNEQKGVNIIKTLQEKGVYIDTLLYSNNPKELILLTEGKNYINGIHRHATLGSIDEKINSLIDINLYKEYMAYERARLFELKD
ncbi:MAG TPA: hypothetical protein VGK10_16135 [Prolixibacteraceae bacterium]|jgi:hypothetical protein